MNGLQKKLGPLKVWQWAAIGAALGLAILIYKSRQGGGEVEGTGELFGGTGTGAFGPIDPETGIPYAFEGGGAGAANSGESLDEFLGRVEQLSSAGLLGGSEPAEFVEGPETIIERISSDNPVTAAAKKQQQAKSQQKHDARGGNAGKAGSGKSGKGPGTSTGGSASQGGSSHTSAPHPAQRIAVTGARGIAGPGKGTKQGGGSSAKAGGNRGGGGGGGGGGNRGGGNRGGGGGKGKGKR